MDAATIRADLQAVIARYDVRGGFTEGFELYVEGDTVRLEMNSHFRRPMRLTEPEVTALRLGLAMLRLERPPDEHPAIDGALRRLAELTPEYRDASQKQQRRQSSAAAEGSYMVDHPFRRRRRGISRWCARPFAGAGVCGSCIASLVMLAPSLGRCRRTWR